MRPLMLKMSAFGSYADLQEIDFTKLGTVGLYLITGETGSGKTTIFDAVSFALFGKASGDGRGNCRILRSDFADGKTKTFVELDFAVGDKVYNIKRNIKESGQDVVLTLSDGTRLNGDRDVKSKITEIVGLDREQFAQIVMIAQNDFLRFLQSGTDDRVKILRRIFGTDTLRQFQERLSALAKSKNEKLDLIRRDFDRRNVDIHKRKEQFAEWEAQIKSDKKDLSETDKKLEECDIKKRTLAAELAVAEELRKKFDDLDLFRREQKEHNAKAKATEELKKRAARGETALYKVKPFDDELQKAAADYSEVNNGLTDAKKRETAAVAKSAEAAKYLENLQPPDKARDAFADLSKELEKVFADLKSLTELQTKRNEIIGKQAVSEKNQKEFEALNAAFKKADKLCAAYEEAFLRCQAGIIASGLADGEPCPVCGSKEHPSLAELTGGGVTETELKKAREAKEKLRSEREEKSSLCGTLKAETDTLIKRFLSDVSVFIPNGEWESSESPLAILLAQTKDKADELTELVEKGKKELETLTSDWDNAVKSKTNAQSAAQSAKTLVAERSANEQKLLKIKNAAQSAYETALINNGFTDGEDYKAALLTESELAEYKKQISDYEKRGERLGHDIARLESETAGKQPPDTDGLRLKAEAVNSKAKTLNERRDKINGRLIGTETALNELQRAAADFEKAEKEYAAVRQLSDAANGKLGKLDFETYSQTAYFERILNAANLRLKTMSQNRYTLLRKTDPTDRRKHSGLEIEVFDAYTGKTRYANSLSGGESFIASLALALGLSDTVQQSAGGIRIDAMFIDEGFGTLDTDVLELAVRTLSETAGTNRIVGIISHVAELRDRVDKQVRIEKTTAGSRIKLSV